MKIKIVLLIAWLLCNQLDARVYFLHIPKTGGTTLRLLLEQQLSSNEIYPFRNQKTANAPIKEELVSGHIPYWRCQQLDPNIDEAFKITILRHPVERYLSFLRAKKRADPLMTDLESVLRQRQIPNGKYKEGLVDNALCRYLAQQPNLEGNALLESAKQGLDKFDCVLFFENFTRDTIYLFERLGIEMNDSEIPKMNPTQWEEAKPSILDEVKKLNTFDLQLYEYAKKKNFPKNTRYKIRKPSFDSLLVKASDIDYTFDLPLMGKGWTCREIDSNLITYRWVTDRPADIQFSLCEGLNYKIRFYARPLTAEIEPKVMINGNEIELKKVTDSFYSMYECEIPGHLINSDLTQVTFYSDKAASYRELYPSHHNRNYPPLSFAVSRILISNIRTD